MIEALFSPEPASEADLDPFSDDHEEQDPYYEVGEKL